MYKHYFDYLQKNKPIADALVATERGKMLGNYRVKFSVHGAISHLRCRAHDNAEAEDVCRAVVPDARPLFVQDLGASRVPCKPEG